TKAVLPILSQMDEVNVKMLYPALADGQIAFALDAKWTSKQWQSALPETTKALPLAEMGLVLGLSDAELFRKSLGEYRRLITELFSAVRDLGPGGPGVEIPEPKKEKGKAGDLYYYPLPADWGLDPQIQPTAGVGDKFAALSLSRAHTERLLQE